MVREREEDRKSDGRLGDWLELFQRLRAEEGLHEECFRWAERGGREARSALDCLDLEVREDLGEDDETENEMERMKSLRRWKGFCQRKEGKNDGGADGMYGVVHD